MFDIFFSFLKTEFVAIIVSAIIFFILMFVSLVFLSWLFTFTMDFFKDPGKLAAEHLTPDDIDRQDLEASFFNYKKFTPVEEGGEWSSICSAENPPFPKSVHQELKLTPEEIETKIQIGIEEAKSFKAANESFLILESEIREKQKFPKLFFKIGAWVTAALVLILAPIMFYFITSFFGINLNFKSYSQVKNNQERIEEVTEELLGEIQTIVGQLSDPNQLTMNQIEQISKILPVTVAELQENLDKQSTTSEALKTKLLSDQKELLIQKEKYERMQALSKDEFDAVKSILFEESTKTTRRYYFLGLATSIPVFWFSEFLKSLFLKFLLRLKAVPSRKIIPRRAFDREL